MNSKTNCKKICASKHYNIVQSLHLHTEIHGVLYHDHIVFAFLMKNPVENL